jgi:hypothetical protein
MSATPDEIAAATKRRKEITETLLEVMTGPSFTTKDVRHFQAVSAIFGIDAVVREICSQASNLESRTELALSICLASLAIAIDDTPPPPSDRILKRREQAAERREVEREFKAKLNDGKEAVSSKKPNDRRSITSRDPN